VSLSLASSLDGSIIAQTVYTFWNAPGILSAAFDSSGTTISVVFDQATNRAGMSAVDDACSQLFNPDPGFGLGARCVWQEDAVVTVFLGQMPTVVPGSTLQVRQFALGFGGLRSANGLSQPASSTATIGRPSQLVAPIVSLQGPGIIDPCASLEVCSGLPFLCRNV
jgi:hypothetical protein